MMDVYLHDRPKVIHRHRYLAAQEVCRTLFLLCVLLSGLAFPAILVPRALSASYNAVEQALHIACSVTSSLGIIATLGFSPQSLLLASLIALTTSPKNLMARWARLRPSESG